MFKLASLLLILAGLAFAQAAPIFTVSSGTSCTAVLAAPMVVIQCSVSPAAPVTVLSFDPHKLEGPATNALFFSWSGVAMLFSKATPAAPLSFQYGLVGPTGQTIQQAVSGTIPISF